MTIGTQTPSAAEQPAPRTPSFRGDVVWTFLGNAVYAAGQWGILSLFAKLSGAAMLGEYALAVAVTAPAGMLAHLNLRSVLATDTLGRFGFGDYLAVRLGASALGMAGIAGIAAWVTPDWTMRAAILAVGFGQSCETISDLCYGALQRRHRLRQVALSMMVRTLVTVGALGAVLWTMQHFLAAVCALAAGRLAVLVLYDLPSGIRGETLATTGLASAAAIAKTALPLGLILMLVSLNTNLPRYAVEHFLGGVSLGMFTAVVSFITVGSTMVNALGQSATARLSRLIDRRETAAFRRMAMKIAALIFGIGIAGVLVAVFFGREVLVLLYRPEFGEQQRLLVAAMAAGSLSYVAIALGYAVTSARVFGTQLPLFALSAAFCAAASWMLVPPLGLYGGVAALGLASLLQIAGQFWLLRRKLAALERSA